MYRIIIGSLLCATLAGCSGCDIHYGGDQTFKDDVIQRLMKLEKAKDESDANFKALGQFAQEVQKALVEAKKSGTPGAVPTPTPEKK